MVSNNFQGDRLSLHRLNLLSRYAYILDNVIQLVKFSVKQCCSLMDRQLYKDRQEDAIMLKEI